MITPRSKATIFGRYKVGDKVEVIERSVYYPNGFYTWPGEIIAIESNYIETEFYRTPEPFMQKLCEGLANNNRTYIKQTVKNYFHPVTKEINILTPTP